MRKTIGMIMILFVLFSPTALAEGNFGESDRSVIEGINQLEEVETENEESVGNVGESDSNFNEAEIEEGAVIPQNQNLFMLFGQLILALGAVLLLFYIIAKFVGNKSRRFQDAATIQSVGGVGVGTNRSVQLVKVGDRLLVVGVGESISLLKEIDDPEEIKAMLKRESQTSFNQPQQLVQSLLQKRRERNGEPPGPSSFNQFLSKELDGVKKSQTKVHQELEERDR
ncbi:flagellar biosynthetic protein FliO [Paenalkalicoccus suaedae]|uniref:Flagellar biosynthetic protein FliO n=1 Tax=Paenalkalicoccus suaedae TaxID=2592382 RepID=A0A859FGT5_9BACI|nr:flagellar biosynthetic protein FliO [Paenalkalicoccus suaedae]QKS71426.1 flagellar biosynthetic protein FliO [Paenalkalicoccus suaedae]